MADIQLSAQLFQDIQAAITKQHPDADQGVVMQYLAALMGYMLASQRQMQPDEQRDFLEQLCAFAHHVYDDVAGQQQEQQQQPQEQQHTQAQAFGYWDPPHD